MEKTVKKILYVGPLWRHSAWLYRPRATALWDAAWSRRTRLVAGDLRAAAEARGSGGGQRARTAAISSRPRRPGTRRAAKKWRRRRPAVRRSWTRPRRAGRRARREGEGDVWTFCGKALHVFCNYWLVLLHVNLWAAELFHCSRGSFL